MPIIPFFINLMSLRTYENIDTNILTDMELTRFPIYAAAYTWIDKSIIVGFINYLKLDRQLVQGKNNNQGKNKICTGEE